MQQDKFRQDNRIDKVFIMNEKTIRIPTVKRNERRFPPDFMFRLTKKEKGELVTNCDRFERLKHSSALPRALMTPPAKPRKKIGFIVKEKQAAYGKRTKGSRRKK